MRLLPAEVGRASSGARGPVERPSRSRAQRVLRLCIGHLDMEWLRESLGKAEYAGLSDRQRTRLVRQLEIITAWQKYQRAVRVCWGRVGPERQGFLRLAGRWWEGRISGRKFREWLLKLKGGGPRALVDRRGRPRGAAPVDAGLWREFRRLVHSGMSIPKAHARMQERAVREGRRWLALRTARDRLRRVRLGSYLVKGVSRN